eukprot:scaffold36289_cov16-Tisochrysis_lutea.AAC.3
MQPELSNAAEALERKEIAEAAKVAEFLKGGDLEKERIKEKRGNPVKFGPAAQVVGRQRHTSLASRRGRIRARRSGPGKRYGHINNKSTCNGLRHRSRRRSEGLGLITHPA